jgi:hypothetical protein
MVLTNPVVQKSDLGVFMDIRDTCLAKIHLANAKHDQLSDFYLQTQIVPWIRRPGDYLLLFRVGLALSFVWLTEARGLCWQGLKVPLPCSNADMNLNKFNTYYGQRFGYYAELALEMSGNPAL